MHNGVLNVNADELMTDVWECGNARRRRRRNIIRIANTMQCDERDACTLYANRSQMKAKMSVNKWKLVRWVGDGVSLCRMPPCACARQLPLKMHLNWRWTSLVFSLFFCKIVIRMKSNSLIFFLSLVLSCKAVTRFSLTPAPPSPMPTDNNFWCVSTQNYDFIILRRKHVNESPARGRAPLKSMTLHFSPAFKSTRG